MTRSQACDQQITKSTNNQINKSNMSEPQHLIHIKAALQVKRAPLYASVMRWAWRLIAAGLIAALVIFLVINFTAIPSFRELEDPNSAVASEVLANNNEVLGRYFIENRVPVTYDELSPNLVQALIATEDERFMKHSGIDYQAIARVVFRTILLSDQSAGGGSTITQQLAKMLYSDRNFGDMNKVEKFFALVYRKLREWITAVKLERSYTKEEIIAMYLNQFNFINNAYGIHAAAEVYFGKKPKDLGVEEAATLIGMLQNPALYNPVRHPERCIRRRYIVLLQMKRNGFLAPAQFDIVKVRPLDMSRFKKVTFTDDKAPYLCAELKKDIAAILEAPESRKSDGSKYNIYKDGLKIYTTVDPAYQRHAEAAVQEHMRKIQSRFFAVWKGRDPWSYRNSEVTEEEIQQRKESLWSLVRQGDRFQSAWAKYLGASEEKIKQRFDFDLRDIDIERMLKEDKKAGALARMAKDGYVSSEQTSAYRRIMNSNEWAEIKNQYRALTVAVQKQYNTKMKMKVFSWSAPRNERDTIMSPMDSLRYHRMFLQTGVLAVDPTTNEIKAWVGGINFKYFQFDHIRTDRQVGSTFKPFVYATAIDQQHISPCFEVYDQAVTIPARYQNFTHITDWTPKDAAGQYSGLRMNLKEALKNSVNSVSAYLMKQMGDTELVRGLIDNMGIDSAARRPDRQYRVPKSPSICLGASDLTVMEMAGAYSTFANKGMYGKPFVIKKIEDKNGRVIYRSLPEEQMALSPNSNYVMVDMLKYNIKGAPGINTLKSEVGGKTGTTNDYTDGWFMGITPRLVVGTWVGGEDRWIRFLSLNDGQGAKMARPIFAGFVGRLEKDKSSGYDVNARFVRPAGDLGIEINCAAYAGSAYGSPTGDEAFGVDHYGDEEGLLPEGKGAPGSEKKKKPDETFGDEDDN
jgi:penicillin-binding protein 1A